MKAWVGTQSREGVARSLAAPYDHGQPAAGRRVETFR
jgi:hypothetical protein